MLKSINTDPRFLKHLINENIFNKHNSPFYLLDVGAANGIHSMWNVFGNNFKAIGFEPDKDSFYQLQNTENVKYENIALGEQNTHTDFYLSAHPQNSGSFPQNVKFLNRLACIDFQRPDFLNEELITLEIQTFESYIKNNSIPQVDFIKIDTEGMELKILQGYGESLDNVLGIQTEVAFCESHHGRPLFKDIDGFLQSKGFTLFDMEIFKP
jgi:FkbM family methyltransferase